LYLESTYWIHIPEVSNLAPEGSCDIRRYVCFLKSNVNRGGEFDSCHSRPWRHQALWRLPALLLPLKQWFEVQFIPVRLRFSGFLARPRRSESTPANLARMNDFVSNWRSFYTDGVVVQFDLGSCVVIPFSFYMKTTLSRMTTRRRKTM